MKTEAYVDYMVEETKKILSIDSPSGFTKEVAEFVMEEYRKLGYEPQQTVKGGVLVAIGGKNKKDALMLEAHIDTLGAVVAEIKANGRLRVSPVGGMNPNNAEAAINRACALIEELGAGEVVGGMVDVYPEKKTEKRIQDQG